MENLNNTHTDDHLVITEESKRHLLEASKWMKFQAIAGFVVLGFMVLSLFMLLFLGNALKVMPAGFDFSPWLALGYLVLITIGLFPPYFLLKTARGIRQSITAGSTTRLAEGFKNMKYYYVYTGIIIIVFLFFYLLTILAFPIIRSLVQ